MRRVSNWQEEKKCKSEKIEKGIERIVKGGK